MMPAVTRSNSMRAGGGDGTRDITLGGPGMEHQTLAVPRRIAELVGTAGGGEIDGFANLTVDRHVQH